MIFTSLSPSSHYIPPLLFNGNIYEFNHDTANILNNYFQSQTILQAHDHVNLSSSNAVEQSLHDFDISIEDVVDSNKMLRTGMATGPDSINSYVLREIASAIYSPLRDLFSYSLRSGKVPSQWKLAHVCAVFKKADPQEISNYRPISLLIVVGKVLERILHKYMFNFYRESDFFSPFLSGFIPFISLYQRILQSTNLRHYIILSVELLTRAREFKLFSVI